MDKLTVKQAAERKQLTPSRIRQLIYASVLPALKVGSMWLIDPAALDAVRVYNRSGRPPKPKAATPGRVKRAAA